MLSDTIRVVEIDIRKDFSNKCFGAMDFVFERLDMLRGWIASSI